MTLKPEPYWCTSSPNVPRIFSASSFKVLGQCRRKFYYQYVCGYEGRGTNLDFSFGTALHKCLEWYWKKRIIHGLDLAQALDSTTGVAMALGLFLPQPSRPNQRGKTRKGLVNAVIAYIDHWSAQDDVEDFAIIEGQPALEQHFQIVLPLINSDGEHYQFQGYVDSLRTFTGVPTTVDYKSTTGDPSEFYLSQFNISIQVAGYTAASRVLTKDFYTQFMADVIGVDTRTRELPYEIPVAFMKRKLVTLTPDSLDEFIQDMVALIRDAERCAEDSYWPKNETGCKFCDFKDICTKSPLQRESFLNTEFKVNRRKTVGRRVEE